MLPFDPRLPIIAAQAKVKTCHTYHCWHAMRDMGAAFHLEAFAAFAGLETRHVEAIMAAIEQHAPLTAKRATAARGTRLPHKSAGTFRKNEIQVSPGQLVECGQKQEGPQHAQRQRQTGQETRLGE